MILWPDGLIIRFFPDGKNRLNQFDSGFAACGTLVFGPDTRLDFPDVGFLEEEHAKPGLTYTSTYAQREFSIEQSSVEIQLGTFSLAGKFKLAAHGCGIYSYAH